jgi:hypothetical protein
MLKVTIPATELYDEVSNEFIACEECTLQLEHSLVSLSKWESRWNKPFLSKEKKTIEQSLDYVKCMTLTEDVDDNVYNFIPDKVMNKISNYIEAEMTATKISDNNQSTKRETITAELIYYWMIALNIPIVWEERHLNRLLTLINVCNIKNSPPKKMSRNEIASRNAALNAARKKQLNTKG